MTKMDIETELMELNITEITSVYDKGLWEVFLYNYPDDGVFFNVEFVGKKDAMFLVALENSIEEAKKSNK